MNKFLQDYILILFTITSSIIAVFITAQFQMQAVYGQSDINKNNDLISNSIKTINPTYNNQVNKAFGIVKNGTFILVDNKELRELTTTAIMEATTPERGKINLTKFEGHIIQVSYQQMDDKWIWGASIIDVGKPSN